MKKYRFYRFSIILIEVAFLSACSLVENFDDSVYEDPLITKAELTRSGEIPYHVSRKTAEYYVKLVYPDLSIKEVIPYVSSKDTLFYVFNFEKGWKAISADMRTSPVLAESDDETFDLEETLRRPSSDWISCAEDLLYQLKETTDAPTETGGVMLWESCKSIAEQTWRNKLDAVGIKTKSVGDDECALHWVKVLVSNATTYTTVENIPHLIQTKWGQFSPWNEKTPYRSLYGVLKHSATCCVATTVSQIQYYLNQTIGSPTGLYESVSVPYRGNATYQDISLSNYVDSSSRWESMPLTKSSSGNASFVADLMSANGKFLNVLYGLGQSSAYCSVLQFANCGLQTSSDAYDIDIVTADLRSNKPVIITARPNGHCWIIDGYYHLRQDSSTTYAYYYVDDVSSVSGTYMGYDVESVYSNLEMEAIYPGYCNGCQVTDEAVYNNRYLLMNWGWEGKDDNNYYSIYNQDPWLAGGYSFYLDRTIYHNINIL